MRRHCHLSAVVFCLLTTAAAAAASEPDWRRYDVNKDGRFDEADKKVIFKSGTWAPTLDVNGDGRKDTNDAFALLLLQTTWDRNADLVVTADDFTPRPPLALPEPDATAASRLVSASVQELAGKVPADLDDKLQQEWEPLKVLTAPDRGVLYEESGAAALTLHNLEVAQWAFTKACQLAPGRDSVWANLGYALAQKDRYADALVLLAYARSRNPRSAATSDNIGWIFARQEQLDLARQYYEEAIAAQPRIGQYHLNLGIVLLRLGDAAGARAEFALASSLAPSNRDALYMALASNPPSPARTEEVQDRYEQEQAEFNKTASDDEKQTRRWSDLDAAERIEEVLRQASDRVMREKAAALKDLDEQTRMRMWEAAEPAVPKWKSAVEDFKRWKAHAQSAYNGVEQVLADGERRAREIATQYDRKAGAAMLEAGPQVLQMALTQAQADTAGYSSGAQARQAFDRTVDKLYTREMALAEKQMRTAVGVGHLRLSPDDTNAARFMTLGGYMAIIDRATSDAAYCGDFLKRREDFPGLNVNTKVQPLDEPTFGLSIAVVGVEWNAQDNEFKLQVGQGIIVAGTWSPKSGFGFQTGVGVDVSEGPLKVKAGNFIKFGSDGSISVDCEGGASVNGGALEMGWSGTASSPIRTAMYEPVGTLE